jgi:hypothetical protein
MRFAVLLVLTLAVPAAALSAVRRAPAPCTLIATKTASAYLHAPAKAYPERARDGVTLCLYIASPGRLQIEDGSRSNFAKASLASSPPGTVIKREPSLGENGGLVYNTRKAYHFADAAFERGPYYYAVYSQAIPAAKVLKLAELVHKKVAHE